MNLFRIILTLLKNNIQASITQSLPKIMKLLVTRENPQTSKDQDKNN